MKFLIGRKLHMTQQFTDDGTASGVTLVQISPCIVTGIWRSELHGRNAIQLSCEPVKRPTKKHPERVVYRAVREFPCDAKLADSVKVGDTVDESLFANGDAIQVQGTMKGRGFQGVVKRHGFHGSPKSHGHKDQLRMPGSVGQSTNVSRVFKGKRMGGRMGGVTRTVTGLQILAVDSERHQVAVKGGIPGARNSLVLLISKS